MSALETAGRDGLMPSGGPILLAVSGGADSMALWTGAMRLARRFGWVLSVAHVHHGWRGREADRDLAFVRDHARRFGLPFHWRRRDARSESRSLGLSPEAGARRVRYAALAEMAREAGVERIATAHQADDRLETYLLAAERRGGIASLGGPRRRRQDGVVRPLLEVSRAEVLAHLRACGVSYRRDASNGDLRLARNRMRRRMTCASPWVRARWEAEARRWSQRRDRIDEEFTERAAPALTYGPDAVLADANAWLGCSEEAQRRAIEAAAAPFARPGRPPMTGREREEILRRLALGTDFRAETGRRISIERRGPVLSFRLKRRAETRAGVYDSSLPRHHGEPAF